MKNVGEFLLKKLWVIIVLALFWGLCSWIGYMSMPASSLSNTVAWFIIVFFLYAAVIFIRLFTIKESEDAFTSYSGVTPKLYFIPTAVLVIVCIVWLINSPAFSAKEYYLYVESKVTVVEDYTTQTGETVKPFPELIKNGDTSKLPLYGIPEAKKMANPVLGQYAGLGSQFELRDELFTSQNVNGTLSYIVPLEPKSMFKWDKNEGSMGYLRTNRNTGETELVKDTLFYTEYAPFSSKVQRLLHKINPNEKITDISPEVDDNGKFYYVATTYVHNVIGGIKIVTGVMILNPTTGEVNKYGLDEIPEWVDRVFPESFFADYLKYYGAYKSGWLNSFIGQKGVQEATSDINVVYIDGSCFYCTGWTIAGKKSSSNGIIMMNSRTGEITLYKTFGISESEAQGVAQGLVQEKGYIASYPVLLEIAGQETFFMLMRDAKDNFMGYAFVSYKDSRKAAVGKTLMEAQSAYIKSLATSNSSDTLVDSNFETVKGVISDITSEVIEGNTIYYVRIDVKGQIYSFYSKLAPEIVFAKVGDAIEIKFIPTGEVVISAADVKLK